MLKKFKKIVAATAAIMMMSSTFSVGATTSPNPYTYGNDPVFYGKVTKISGSRYTSYASSKSYSKKVSVGVEVTQYYYNSKGKLKSRTSEAYSNNDYAKVEATVKTPTGGSYSYSAISHYRNNIAIGNYTVKK